MPPRTDDKFYAQIALSNLLDFCELPWKSQKLCGKLKVTRKYFWDRNLQIYRKLQNYIN